MQTEPAPAPSELYEQLLPDKDEFSREIQTLIMLAKPLQLKGAKDGVERELGCLAPFTDSSTLERLKAVVMTEIDRHIPAVTFESARENIKALVKRFVPKVATVELTMDRVGSKFVPDLKIIVRDGEYEEAHLMNLLSFEGVECRREPVNIASNEGTVEGMCFTLRFYEVYNIDPTEDWYSEHEVFDVEDLRTGIRTFRKKIDDGTVTV